MPNESKTTLSDDDVKQISLLLGRDPRGLEDVAFRAPSGEPMVIRVASLVDNAPFPNLFWLVDPAIVYRIDGDEAGGLIQRLQKIVDADTELQAGLIDDHRAHIILRNSYMTAAVEEQLRSLNYYQVLQNRGIGGIADFGRIRCLHTWYAAHLVVPNTIGGLLDSQWSSEERMGVSESS
jgi:hypothetical protein